MTARRRYRGMATFHLREHRLGKTLGYPVWSIRTTERYVRCPMPDCAVVRRNPRMKSLLHKGRKP